MTKKTVLITGCSSGFGKLTAKLFHSKGWNVIATMRNPAKEAELNQLENILLLPLDVTDVKSVGDAVAAGLEKYGRIDVLVNNAGKSGEASFEQFGEADVHSMFDANTLGTIRVTQAVLPAMRKQGEGVVVNISSVAGLLGSPCSAVYSASKFAVEGLTEALAVEYAPFNIKFKVIAPGSYDTNLIASSDRSLLQNGDDQIKEYASNLIKQMDAVIANLREEGGQTADPQEVADKIYLCATEDTPIHNVSGADAEGIMHMKKTMSEDELMQAVAGMFGSAAE